MWARKSRYWRNSRLAQVLAAIDVAARLIAAIRVDHHHQAAENHGYGQEHSHGEPAAHEVADVGIRQAHPLDREAREAVYGQEQTGGSQARPRRARVPPQNQEQHQTLERCFIELRRVPAHELARLGIGHEKTPGQAGRFAPQLAVDEIADAAGEQPDPGQRRRKIQHIGRMLALDAGE